jgi:hypothetical protein
MTSTVTRVIGGTAVLAGGLLLATAALAGQQLPGPAATKPALHPPAGAVQPAGGVPPGQMPLPDLDLSEVRINPLRKIGTMPNGASCYEFTLQPVFMNLGTVGTGPFRVIWERGSAATGPFALACDACSQPVPDAPPGIGMLPAPRSFNNCAGVKYYRVRLDPDNAGLELRDDNNDKVVGF